MRRGFTLVEMLLVTAILALATGVLAATLGAGIRALDTARFFQAAECSSLAGLEKMEQDMSRVSPCRMLKFSGRAMSVSFPVMLGEPGGNDWAPGTARYAYDPVEKVIRRQVWPYTALEPADGSGETVVERSVGCRFMFYECPDGRGAGGAWLNEWTDGTNMPGGVRVELEIERNTGILRTQRTFFVFAVVPPDEGAVSEGGRP